MGKENRTIPIYTDFKYILDYYDVNNCGFYVRNPDSIFHLDLCCRPINFELTIFRFEIDCNSSSVYSERVDLLRAFYVYLNNRLYYARTNL